MLCRFIDWVLVMVVTCITLTAPVAASPYGVAGSFVALSYHDVRDDVRDYPDPYAIDSAALVGQFAWLRGNGYTPVSLNEIVAARKGGKPLPEKAVLLTFDDAYLSFYTRVYPLLREFNFPAVLAVVGKWIDAPEDAKVQYGEKSSIATASFPTWQQLREMADSGLVEMASHTYNLHRGVLANPQANLQPAATARIYDAATGGYEDDTSWRARVSADLAQNAITIQRETGHRPRAIVWPYGSYNDELVRMAGDLGMTIGLTLDDGANTPEVPLKALRRTLIEHNPTLAEFIGELHGPRYPEPVRVVQVNLDDVYSADPARQERNLSTLLDRVQMLKPTHVYLQATVDTDGDGITDMTYFPNRHLPMLGNLFNRAAWQLASRVDVKVFAVMPVRTIRLAPIKIAEVYEDLARYANFDGLVFDDKWTPEGIDSASLEFTHELATRVRAFREPLPTVRTVYMDALAATAPDALDTRQTMRQLATIAAKYDYVAQISTPTCGSLARVDGTPDETEIRRKTVFMLQSSRLPGDRQGCNAMVRQMRALQFGGALNFGYIADDFLRDSPPLAQIAPVMSLRIYPLAKGREEK